MNELFYSMPTLLLCTIGFYISWLYYKKDNFAIAVLLLMACGLILKIYTIADFFLHNWDERYHALVAKNLIQHPLLPTLYDKPILPYDYKLWTANHVWVHKQPLPLWAMAGSMYLFGVNEIALRIPSAILMTIGIGLTFYIGKYLFDTSIGYLAAFFYAINGLILEQTGGRVATDHIDIFFLFFVELAVFFSIVFIQKQKTIYNILAGISIGAAILCKWLPALIVLPIWLLLVIDSKKFKPSAIIGQLLLLTTICIFTFLPWQIYIFSTFPAEATWEAGFNFKHITEVLDEQTGPIYYFLGKIRVNYGDLIYLPLLWFIWKSCANKHQLKRLALLIWVLVPLVFFSIAKTKMQGYILFICPALFLITADFYFMLNEYKKKPKMKWFSNIISLLLIALPIRYMLERVKPFEQRDRNPTWAIELRKLNDRKVHNGVLFNYQRPIEAMFYTSLTVYPNIPDRNKITELIAIGYTVIINDDGKIPEEIKTIEGITIEKL